VENRVSSPEKAERKEKIEGEARRRKGKGLVCSMKGNFQKEEKLCRGESPRGTAKPGKKVKEIGHKYIGTPHRGGKLTQIPLAEGRDEKTNWVEEGFLLRDQSSVARKRSADEGSVEGKNVLEDRMNERAVSRAASNR